MDAEAVSIGHMAMRERSVPEVFARERGRLRGFIRRYVPDLADAEDIFQEVFSEFVEAARLLQPIEQVGAWLLRVARNRIYDRSRRRAVAAVADDSASALDMLPIPAGDTPEGAFARALLLEELDAALDELPAEQRDVFVAHELEGRSFKALAEETGVGVNTLLSRKRYAVLYLRRRLQAIHDEFSS